MSHAKMHFRAFDSLVFSGEPFGGSVLRLSTTNDRRSG
jgi:hypothetical protein